MTFLIPILAFISIILAAIGIYYYISPREVSRERLEKIGGKGVVDEEAISPGLRAVRESLLRILQSFGRIALPKKEEEVSHMRRRFLIAGYKGPYATIVFYGGKVFLALLLLLLFTFLRLIFIKLLPHFQTVFLSILSAIIGFYLPNLWIHVKIRRRKENILRGFPDALDLLVVCVEAGLGLDMAINRVGQEIEMSVPVLSEEFKIMNREIRAGKSRQDALRGLALRTELEDVSSLTALLIQTEQFGTSVAQALRVHSDAMRTRRRQRAEEAAAKVPVKMLFPLIFFIFPSIVLVIVGPGIIRIARVLLPALGGG